MDLICVQDMVLIINVPSLAFFVYLNANSNLNVPQFVFLRLSQLRDSTFSALFSNN